MKKYDFITKELLIKEYSKNEKSTNLIAKELGCSRQVIRNRLAEFEIKTRTPSESRKGSKNGMFGKCHTIEAKKKISIKNKGKLIGSANFMFGKHHTKEARRKIKENRVYVCGKDHIKYNPERHKIHYCIEKDCNKEINYNTWKNGQGRCHFCAGKILWKNKEYRNKVIKAQRKGMKLSINKSEKLLNNLLNKNFPKEYKYVGNGRIIIDKYNPDFINCNGQKKIIELFGCYWHKCSECGFGKKKLRPTDIGRLKVYTKHGYQTLIIWEHELKDLNKVKTKILKFN